MARIVLGSYMFRYPLGGMLSWVLQYLFGLKDLGHDVYFVEKYGYENACYDPLRNVMSDDCSYGLQVVSELLDRFGLEGKWCFVERGEHYHGMPRAAIEEVFRTADLFIDMGTHGSWAEESSWRTRRVLIDGEPAYTQIKMANKIAAGQPLETYDVYYTNGKNIGLNGNPAPALGINWGHLFHPVKTAVFHNKPVVPNAPFSTIMNWQSHQPIEYQGKIYGQKNIEFEKFFSLPKQVDVAMEVAVSGNKIPKDRLTAHGWNIKDGREVTRSFDSFRTYLSVSKGEFSVCKNVFVENQNGWFSDKSAAYLASGRPVVLQDTGFSRHLPCGEGLFAVSKLEEARDAIDEINGNYPKHSRAAREIACTFLEAEKVMKQFLDELGM